MGKANLTDAFKRDAVCQITERGYPVSEVSNWKAKGFLRVGKFRFEITDLARLRAYATGLDRNSPARFANQQRQARLAQA